MLRPGIQKGNVTAVKRPSTIGLTPLEQTTETMTLALMTTLL